MFCIRKACCFADVFTQSIIKMCLMCQNIMKISWDRLWAQCLSSGNFFDVCDAKHLSFVDSLYVYSSLYVRNECVPIRILLLCTESMFFAYDCKLHAIAYLNTTLAISAVYAIVYLLCTLCTFSVCSTLVPAWSICQNVPKQNFFFFDSLHWQTSRYFYTNLY